MQFQHYAVREVKAAQCDKSAIDLKFEPVAGMAQCVAPASLEHKLRFNRHSVTCVAFTPNCSPSGWLAAGTRCGIVRVDHLCALLDE